jgi:hypothetical protein
MANGRLELKEIITVRKFKPPIDEKTEKVDNAHEVQGKAEEVSHDSKS